MKWTFKITETSNGAYRCTGKRVSGNIVSTQCDEDDMFRVFKQAYTLEVELGALPSKALFTVVSSAKPNWSSEYNDQAFGSWMVGDRNGQGNFVYDGKDFWLKIYEASEKPVWQGQVRENEDVQDAIFQFLI